MLEFHSCYFYYNGWHLWYVRGAGLLFVVSDIQKLIYLSRGWGPMFSSVYFLLVYSDVMLSNPCDVKCVLDYLSKCWGPTLLVYLVLCYMFNVVFLLLQVLCESLWSIYVISLGILEPSLVKHLVYFIYFLIYLFDI